MTLTLEKVISPDLCEGSEWVVADEDALAEHVARIAVGQYRHVAKILLGEGATAAAVMCPARFQAGRFQVHGNPLLLAQGLAKRLEFLGRIDQLILRLPVVSRRPAIEAAFSSAVRATLVGSITPAFTRSS